MVVNRFIQIKTPLGELPYFNIYYRKRWQMGYLIVFVVAFALAYALQPKPVVPKPATLSDFNVPTAEPGRPIPMVFGTVLLRSPNVVWYGDLSYSKIKTKSGK